MTLRFCSDVAEECSYVLLADTWGNPCCCRRGNLQQNSSSKTVVIARNFDSYFCSIFGLGKLSTALTAHKLTGLWQDAYRIQTKNNQSKTQKDENGQGGTVLNKRITQHISFDDFFLKQLWTESTNLENFSRSQEEKWDYFWSTKRCRDALGSALLKPSILFLCALFIKKTMERHRHIWYKEKFSWKWSMWGRAFHVSTEQSTWGTGQFTWGRELYFIRIYLEIGSFLKVVAFGYIRRKKAKRLMITMYFCPK